MSADDGVWVKVWPEFVPAGAFDWAKIGSVAGVGYKSDIEVNGEPMRVYQFTGTLASGAVNVTEPGLVDGWVVSGGGGCWSREYGYGPTTWGAGGPITGGYFNLLSGNHEVVVGTGGPNSTSDAAYASGGYSQLGDNRSSQVNTYIVGAANEGKGMNVRATGITETVTEFSYNGQYQRPGNTGDGGNTNSVGSNGIVIMRVPLTSLEGVDDSGFVEPDSTYLAEELRMQQVRQDQEVTE